jgi:hypothetical protein
MATPADERLLALLDKWLGSLDLHRQYTELDAAGYANVQAWPPHQRPSRWIIDLAREKVIALQTQVRERIQAGDAGFADAMEAMMFLANLVGAEHIERFIPLAAPRPPAELPPVVEPPSLAAPPPVVETPPSGDAGTREMPRYPATKPRAATPGTRTVARSERRSKAAQAAAPAAMLDAASEQVIADAERLMEWGRKWYELAELIARMADRPPLPEVRRILKDHKRLIDDRVSRKKD